MAAQATFSPRLRINDLIQSPNHADTLYAATHQRRRSAFGFDGGGPGSALWKSTDAGATWTKIQGGGWPETPKGRIEIAVYPGDPNVVYTMVEADSVRGRRAAAGAERQKLANGLYRTKDGGRTWEKMNDANVRPFYYSQVRVHPTNPERVWFSSTPVLVSNDGGKTTQRAMEGVHVDHHAMWIDPTDPQRMIVGNDGGVALSWDGGGSWDFQNQMALGQFYEVSYDMAVPYRVCGGLQDNGSWCGPSRPSSPPRTRGARCCAGPPRLPGFDIAADSVPQSWIVIGRSGSSRAAARVHAKHFRRVFVLRQSQQ